MIEQHHQNIIADCIKEILAALGENPDRDGLQNTPKRVAKAFLELTKGYAENPAEILTTQFDLKNYDGMIILKNAEFTSLCEHHLLSFEGTASIAYIPGNDKVVGLSKLSRLLDCFARRLQLQERLTNEIAGAIKAHLQPLGVGVIISSKHSCMRVRGVQKDGTMITSAMLGAFRDDVNVKAEFLSLVGNV